MSTLTMKERQKLDRSNFGSPSDKKFPIMDADDVRSAARLVGKAANPEAVKKRIIQIAKRKGLASALPDSWKKED